jgi:hypothetical protein
MEILKQFMAKTRQGGGRSNPAYPHSSIRSGTLRLCSFALANDSASTTSRCGVVGDS